MTNRKLISLGVLAVTGGLLSCGGVEPALGCRVQSINWAARYDLVSVDDPAGTGACAQLKGEFLGMQRYNENKPGTEKMAIRPYRLGALDAADDDPNHVPYALGKLPDNPTDGFCAATDMSVAEQMLGTTLHRYKFSNVKVLVTEAAPGQQMAADLEYSVGDCTAHYKVRAVFPAAKCTDDSGCALPKVSMNPDFATVCMPGVHSDAKNFDAQPVSACVPANDIPSLKAAPTGT